MILRKRGDVHGTVGSSDDAGGIKTELGSDIRAEGTETGEVPQAAVASVDRDDNAMEERDETWSEEGGKREAISLYFSCRC